MVWLRGFIGLALHYISVALTFSIIVVRARGRRPYAGKGGV